MIHSLVISMPIIVCAVFAMLMLLDLRMLYLLMSDKEIAQFIPTYLYGEKGSELTGIAWWQAVAHMVTKSIFALQIIPVVHFGSRSIVKFNQRVEASFADTEGRSLHRQKVLLWIFLATSIASFVCNIIGRQWFDSSAWLLSVPSVLFSALLFCVGREGLMLNFSIQEIMEAEQEEMPNKEKDSEASDEVLATDDDSASAIEQSDHLLKIETNRTRAKGRKMEHIVQRIVDEQLYLQPDLQLNGLATLLCTNRTYISDAIRKEKGMTFYEFINDLRIQHAQKLMKEYPEMAIYEIYTQSGYSNYPTFRRNFVRFTKSQL